MAVKNTVEVKLEISDNGTFRISQKEANELRKQIEAGAEASVLLSKGISDPKKIVALQATVDQAKALTNQINQITRESKAAAQALKSIKTSTATGALDTGLARGTAAAGGRGDARDFARQAQGLGGLVHLYATFAANIWAVSAAYDGLSRSYEAVRLETAAKQLSGTLGVSMKTLAADIKQASGYAVSFKEAMEFGALGTQAGLSAKQITELVKAAKGAANVLGRDVNDSINRMIRGTAKMEQEILDELGIFVRAKDAYKEYAKELGYASEATLTQAERVRAYADAVAKASEKYKKFAEIEDPFSKLKSTISEAGTELLGFVAKYIAPLVNGLAESKTLVEGLLLAGAAYLTKLAIPKLADFKKALTDVTALEKAAEIANKNKVAALKHQYEELKASSLLIPESKLKEFQQKFGSAIGNSIKSADISKKLQDAFEKSTDAVDFQKRIETAITKSASGKALAATRATDEAKKNALLAEAELMKLQSTELSKIIAQDKEIQILLNKRVKTAQDLVILEEKIAAASLRASAAGTREQKRLNTANASNELSGAIIGAFSSLSISESMKNVSQVWGKYTDSTKAAAAGTEKVNAAMLITSTTGKVLLRGIEALMAGLNWVFAIWLAWDLALKPLLKKFGYLTDSAIKYTAALDKMSQSIDTIQESEKQWNAVLSMSTATILDKQKAHEAYAKSYEELAVNIKLSSDSLKEFNKSATLGDVLIERAKDLAGFGIYAKNLEEMNKLADLLGSKQLLNPQDVANLKQINDEIVKLSSASGLDSIHNLLFNFTSIGIISNAVRGINSFFTSLISSMDWYKEYVENYTKDLETLYKKQADALAKATDASLEKSRIEKVKASYADMAATITKGQEDISKALTGGKPGYRFENADLQKSYDTPDILLARAKDLGSITTITDSNSKKKLTDFSDGIKSISLEVTNLSKNISNPTYLAAWKDMLVSLAEFHRLISTGGSKASIDEALKNAEKYGNKAKEVAVQAQEAAKFAAKTEEQLEALRTKARQNYLDFLKDQEKAQYNAAKLASDLSDAEMKREEKTLGYIQQSTLAKVQAAKEAEIIAENELKRRELEVKYIDLMKTAEKTRNGHAEEYLVELNNQSTELEKRLKLQLESYRADAALLSNAQKYTEYMEKQGKLLNSSLAYRKEAANLVASIPGSNLQGNLAVNYSIQSAQLAEQTSQKLMTAKASEVELINQEATQQQNILTATHAISSAEAKRQQRLKTISAELEYQSGVFEIITENAYRYKDVSEASYALNRSISLEIEKTAIELAQVSDATEKEYLTRAKSLEIAKKQYEMTKRLHQAQKEVNGGLDTTLKTISDEMFYRLEDLKKSMKSVTDVIVDSVFNAIDKGVDKLFEQIKAKKTNIKDIFKTMQEEVSNTLYTYQADRVKLFLKDFVFGMLGQERPKTIEELQKSIYEELKSQTAIETQQLDALRGSITELLSSSRGGGIPVQVLNAKEITEPISVAVTSSEVQTAAFNPAIYTDKTPYPNFNVVKASTEIQTAQLQESDRKLAQANLDAQVWSTMTQVKAINGGLQLVADKLDSGNKTLETTLTDPSTGKALSSLVASNTTGFGAGQSIADFGGSIVNFSTKLPGVLGDFTKSIGSTVTDFGISTGNMLNSIGLGSLSMTSLLGMGTSLMSGNWGGAIGAIAGSFLPGGALTGQIVGSLLSGAFGGGHVMRPKAYATMQAGGVNSGDILKAWNNGEGASNKVATDLGSSAIKKLTDQVTSLGGTLKEFELTTKYMGKYNSVGFFYPGTNGKLDAKSYSDKITGARLDRPEEVAGAQATLLLHTIGRGLVEGMPEFLVSIAKEFTKVVGSATDWKTLKDLRDKAVAELELFTSIKGLYDSFKDLPEVFQRFKPLVESADQTTESFAKLSKAIEATQTYYNLFYSEDQRNIFALNANTKKLVSTFKDLGVRMPTTKEGFVTLVDTLKDASGNLSLDKLGIHQKLMDIAPALASWIEYIEQAGEATESIAVTLAQAKSNLTSAWDSLKSVMTNLRDSFKSLKESLLRFRDSLLTGDLSPLTPYEKYIKSKEIYQSTLSATTTGTAEERIAALGRLEEVSTAFLEASKTVYASSPQYQTDFQSVISAVEASASYASQQEQYYNNQLSLLQAQLDGILGIQTQLDTSLPALIDAFYKAQTTYTTVNQSVLDAIAAAKGTVASETGGLPTTFPATTPSTPTIPSTASTLASATLSDLKATIAKYNVPKYSGEWVSGSKKMANSQFAALVNAITVGDLSPVQSIMSLLTKGAANAVALAAAAPHAKGGIANGLSLLGEEGPELVDFNSPARVYTANQTSQLFSSRDADLAKELAKLREEVRSLREEQQIQTEALIQHNYNANNNAAKEVSRQQKENITNVLWVNNSKAKLL